MHKSRYAIIVLFIGLLALAALYGCQQGKAQPIKEGIVWSVTWTVTLPEVKSQNGLFRDKMPDHPGLGQSGEYDVNMYGRLYPTFLEIHRRDRSDSFTQIIPFSQITSLEFGSSN
ncbi:MAG TPA: hypothetical protein VGK34_07965 [Armatimonadota bacterium]|jgi:hypothetical protein